MTNYGIANLRGNFNGNKKELIWINNFTSTWPTYVGEYLAKCLVLPVGY